MKVQKKFTFLEDKINFNEVNNFYSKYQGLLKKINFKNLNNNYQSIIYQEIHKAYIRSVVRFDAKLNSDLLNCLKKKIISLLGADFKKYYITSHPYLLIHLPKDIYEKGRYHTDIMFNTGDSITCWMPINEYKISYNPITIFPNTQNKFQLYLLKFLSKISQKTYEIYTNLFLKKILINALPNSIFFWKDSTIHRGNYNYTDKIHSAITFKISEKENPVETSELLCEEKKGRFLENFNREQILNNLKKIKIFVDNNFNNKFDKKQSIDSLKDLLQINKSNDQLNKILGFATGIIGGRLFFTKFKKESFVFSLISLIFVKNSNDRIYLKNSWTYQYLNKKLPNLEELIK